MQHQPVSAACMWSACASGPCVSCTACNLYGCPSPELNGVLASCCLRTVALQVCQCSSKAPSLLLPWRWPAPSTAAPSLARAGVPARLAARRGTGPATRRGIGSQGQAKIGTQTALMQRQSLQVSDRFQVSVCMRANSQRMPKNRHIAAQGAP